MTSPDNAFQEVCEGFYMDRLSDALWGEALSTVASAVSGRAWTPAITSNGPGIALYVGQLRDAVQESVQ